MRTKTMGCMIAKATLRAHAPPADKPMAKIFFPVPTGSTINDHAPGWYYQIDMATPVGPFDTKPEAIKAAQNTLPQPRLIRVIAREISRDWGAKVYFGAVPYLRAMLSLDSVDDDYGLDSGRSVVMYFLGNATSYRGETARRLKAELKKALGR